VILFPLVRNIERLRVAAYRRFACCDFSALAQSFVSPRDFI